MGGAVEGLGKEKKEEERRRRRSGIQTELGARSGRTCQKHLCLPSPPRLLAVSSAEEKQKERLKEKEEGKEEEVCRSGFTHHCAFY